MSRFIPAGAGNRRTWIPTATATAVHPRWRGEQALTADSQRPDAGSSPLARGTEISDAAAMIEQRFIPAGAGNSCNK